MNWWLRTYWPGWIALGFIVLVLAATFVRADSTRYVDLELVLAADVSASMDLVDRDLQQQGYFQAIISEDVERAIASGNYGRIAITYMEWANTGEQAVVVPWTVVSNRQGLIEFATKVVNGKHLRTNGQGTSISEGLLYASALFGLADVVSDPKRRVIDVSGDGKNDNGPSLAEIKEAILKDGIVINGIPIITERLEKKWQLGRYYEEEVIGGPGSFAVRANGHEDFARALRQKLVLEIAGVDTPEATCDLSAMRHVAPLPNSCDTITALPEHRSAWRSLAAFMQPIGTRSPD